MWESCLTTGSFADLECIIGQGFFSIFGNPIYISAFILVTSLFIIFKMRISFDLGLLFLLSLVFTLSLSIAPQWIFWLLIIVIGIISGFALYRLLRR